MHIFLLTDGAVSNTDAVVKLVKQNTKNSRVHAIGIGNGVSLNLIQGCAEAGKGKSILIQNEENPNKKIIGLLQSTLTPLITNINLFFNDDYVESIVPNPKSLPYILKDEIVNFYITYKKPFTQAEKFTFEYSDSITNFPYKSDIIVGPQAQEHSFVDKMSHLKVIRSLESCA